MSLLAETQSEPCGCDWLNGRCDAHGEMMEAIHHAWTHGDDRACDILWDLQDGYGEPGYVPAQGYDWSGIRDSSVAAVEAMYAAVRA